MSVLPEHNGGWDIEPRPPEIEDGPSEWDIYLSGVARLEKYVCQDCDLPFMARTPRDFGVHCPNCAETNVRRIIE